MPLGRQARRERNRERRERGREGKREKKKIKERILLLPSWAASGRLHWVDRFARALKI